MVKIVDAIIWAINVNWKWLGPLLLGCTMIALVWEIVSIFRGIQEEID